MPGQRIGSAIAAMFGMIYVVVNAGPLPGAWPLTLRVLAAAAAAAVFLAVLRSGPPRDLGGQQQPPVFGRTFRIIVAVEVVALFLGLRVLSGPLHAPEAGVAWVSVVVGVHFLALAVAFGEQFFRGLGGAVTICGVIGLVLAATGAGVQAIALVAGVVPGAVLLGYGWWGAHRTAQVAG